MSQEYSLDEPIQTALVAQLNATVTEMLCGQDNTWLKTLREAQSDTVKAFIQNINYSLHNKFVAEEDVAIRLKILLQSKQILTELAEANSLRIAPTVTQKPSVKDNLIDENTVNFATTSNTKQINKRKRQVLSECTALDEVKVKFKTGLTARQYLGARVFAFEDNEEHEDSLAKRARVEPAPETDEHELWPSMRPVHDTLESESDLFALDSCSEPRHSMNSRECAIDVDLSKFTFDTLEEKLSQPEHISSQPGRPMDVNKKLQQIESYLSETNEPQESSEREEVPSLFEYQLSQTDYAAMVEDAESQPDKGDD